MRQTLPILALPAALLVAPEPADACSPWDPHVERTIPEPGATHPADTPILILGQVLDPAGLQATIDGIPAAVVVDERSEHVDYFLWGPAYRALAVTTDPAPAPGQTVHLFGELCTPDAEASDEQGCQAFDLQLVATDPDASGPELGLDVWYDVYDHGEDAEWSTSCGSTTGRFSVDVWTEIDDDAEAPMYFSLFVRPRDEPGAWSPMDTSWRLEVDHHSPSWHFAYLLHEVERMLPLAEAYCFEVRSEDLAGNPGPSLERCPPCHDQIGPDDGGSFIATFPESAPNYTDAWIVPDGYCPGSIEGGDSGSTGAPADGGDETGDSTGAMPGGSGDPPGAGSGPGADDGATDEGGGAADPDPPGGKGCGCQGGGMPPAAWLILVGIAASAGVSRRRSR